VENRRPRLSVEQNSMAYRVIALVVCVMGISCGAADAPRTSHAVSAAVEAEAPSRPRIVVQGDSLAAGLGLSASEAFPALLQRYIDEGGYDLEVVNAGVSGDTTAGGLRRLDWALDGDPRILVLALGGNDGLRGVPVAEMTKNLDAILSRARERDIAVVLAGMEAPPNYGPVYTAQFRRAFTDLADRHDVTFVPFLLEGIAGNSTLNQADGIHPTAEGARMIADHLWKALEPVVKRTVSHD
jgi:acyl-CoA thioesterase-1